MADKKFVHVLVSASYFAPVALTSAVFTELIRQMMRNAPSIEPERIITYQMGYSLNPAQCGLKDVWNSMKSEHEHFSEVFPELATAIALMCGGDNEQEKRGASSD